MIARLWSIAAALGLMGALAGCKVGPNYQRPATPIPPAFRNASTPSQAAAQSSSFADLKWWQVFQDPALQDLMRTALQHNYDLLLAAERINAARAQLMVTHSAEFPQVTGSADFSGGKSSTLLYTYNLITLAADVNYQLDFFGRLRRATEAARAQLLATEEARRTVALTLVSDVATDYFQLLGLDLQLQISRETITSQQESVRLTQLRLERGVATRADVLQAQQVLDTANAQIPDFERQISQTEDAISILAGKYPDNVTRGRILAQQYLPPEVPPGLTSTLLERRPDIREAEQSLIAANAQIGVARAAFFPQISLTGSGGGVFGTPTLASGFIHSGTWGYGASAAQPIFTGGSLRGNLRLAESQQQQALLSYQQTIQIAFGDVSDALVGYQKRHELRLRQEDSVRTLQEAVRISVLRYRGGITTFLEVLDNQRSFLSAQLTLAQARTAECQALVSLYKALGGGWQQ